MSLSEHFCFFQQYLVDPAAVGAWAPSSKWLAAALAAPFAGRTTPACLLEAGAGTGSVTRRLAGLLRDGDRLDVCEINPVFARVIRERVLAPRAGLPGEVRVLCGPAQEIDAPGTYDFVISSLPLTVFEPDVVEAILGGIRRNLRPGGVFTYFEYVAMRGLAKAVFVGRERTRTHAVSDVLDESIGRYQVACRTVWRNIPPAIVRYWVFDPPDVAPPLGA